MNKDYVKCRQITTNHSEQLLNNSQISNKLKLKPAKVERKLTISRLEGAS